MDTKYVSGLADVVKRTFEVMFPLEAELVECRSEHGREAPFEVSGIIGITGTTRGSLVISFPFKVARQLAAWMLNEEEPENCTNQDMTDCVGELANIIAGNFLPLLNEGGGKTNRISLPSVVVGSHEVVWSRKDSPCDLMRFRTDLGEFAAEVNFREAQD